MLFTINKQNKAKMVESSEKAEVDVKRPKEKSFQWAVTFGSGVVVGFLVAAVITTHIEVCDYDHDQPVTRTAGDVGKSPPSITTDDSNGSDFRILCVVETSPEDYEARVAAINATWGRKCHQLVFTTSLKGSTPPLVELHVEDDDGERHLWKRTKEALKHVTDSGLLEGVDWVLMVDDQTFVVVENLKAALSLVPPEGVVYVGRTPQRGTSDSCGGGYVLSADAISKMGRHPCLRATWTDEDVGIGWCMLLMGGRMVDSVNWMGKQLFNATPTHHETYDPTCQRTTPCCSSAAITFHGLDAVAMRDTYYLLYELQVLQKPNRTF